jgi:hypothetical protein
MHCRRICLLFTICLAPLQVQLPPNAAAGSLSRGQASDMISQAKGALASQQQLQQLQV